MVRKLTPRSSVENFKREAKRWLKALRANDADARARLEQVVPAAAPEPTLRDVQHALALEYGHPGWTSLVDAVESTKHVESPLGDLLDMSARGDIEQVRELLDAYPEIVSERGTLRGHSGLRTALHFAVGGDHEAVVKLLLDRGADPNVRDDGDNAMPLHFAAEKEQFEIVKALIEHGADPIGTGDYHELDVIGWATVFGKARPDIVDYLLTHGARHNIFSAVTTAAVPELPALAADADRAMDKTNHHRRPLHLAIVKKQRASLDTLLELGANPELTDAAGLTPLDQAALNGESEMVRSLLAHGATLGVPAAIALDRDVDRVLEENPGALLPGGKWGTLILRAAEQSPGRVIETLLRHGASVDAIDSDETAVDSTIGYTPLHAAAFAGNIDAVRVLLAHGADVTACDSKYAGTPAGWADYAHHPEIRDLILQGPIDLFDAVRFDRVDRLREIFDRQPGTLNQPLGRKLRKSAKPAEWANAWWTPLAFAVVTGKRDSARALLELGAEPRIRHPARKTLREIAVETGNTDIAVLLDEFAPFTPPSPLVARFLSNACPDHHVRGRPAHQIALHTASRLLRNHPEIARDSIYTAVVCGDLEYVQSALTSRAELAREKGGPKGSAGGRGSSFTLGATAASHPLWEPLLYLCFTRLDRAPSNDNAIAIATMLLDHGADPNSYFMAGDSRYSPLTGVIGEGEEDRPPHSRRDELTRLLLERGANPYDGQVFYDIHFHGDVLWYLKLIYEHTVKIGRGSDWNDPSWSMIDEGNYGLGARYLLNIAVAKNDLELAEWILAHGASPNAMMPPESPLKQPSLHEIALRRGYTEMADLLIRFGATPSGFHPEAEDAFAVACLRLDRAEAKRLSTRHPEYLSSTKTIFEAAKRDNAEAVRLLIELGTPIEIEDKNKQRPLHVAAYADAVDVAKLLIERGAEIDPVETNWGNSPLDFARYAQHVRMIDLLAPYSRDLWSLAFTGKVDRLRELLTAEPKLAKWALSNGLTPLMRLPDDEKKAREIVELFLAHGADASRKNDQGLTAADIADRREMPEIATLLRSS